MSFSVPHIPFRTGPIITTMTPESIGYGMRLTTSGPASTAWGVANQARYVPFIIPEPITVVKLLALNGSTAAGNTDIGLYDEAGNEVVGIAAAAQAGTTAWQEFDIADTPILPGLYYVGLLNSGTTGTYIAFAGNKEASRAMGVFSQAVGAANLPSPTATFAALDSAMVPVVGMATRTLI